MIMRKFFADLVRTEMKHNKEVFVLTGDLGYKMWDEVRAEYPDRFINVGAAEQSMIGVATGLALSGKVTLVYSITPFLLYRPFETIRNYIHHEKIPVKLIGGGRNRDYAHNGFSHWAEEDAKIMKILSNISARWPTTNEELETTFREMITTPAPYYINLYR
jgi:transketolase